MALPRRCIQLVGLAATSRCVAITPKVLGCGGLGFRGLGFGIRVILGLCGDNGK